MRQAARNTLGPSASICSRGEARTGRARVGGRAAPCAARLASAASISIRVEGIDERRWVLALAVAQEVEDRQAGLVAADQFAVDGEGLRPELHSLRRSSARTPASLSSCGGAALYPPRRGHVPAGRYSRQFGRTLGDAGKANLVAALTPQKLPKFLSDRPPVHLNPLKLLARPTGIEPVFPP